MSDVLELTLRALRTRITGVFPAQIHAAVQPLTEEQIWWRPNEASNSIGNLILHLTGSLNHFLNRNLGSLDYSRDRAAEFAERRTIPRAELLAVFDEMVANADRTFEQLTVARLSEASPEPKMSTVVLEDLLNVLAHFSTHVGQILWIAKMQAEGSIDEVWIHSHRDQGAWKK
jgi:uncharacterized damage-inducible protein DinB